MKGYNGFTATQRYDANKWLKEQQSKGLRVLYPDKCDVCGQTEGILLFHSEDYSEPYGEHIGQFSLCYCCHSMIHSRFHNPIAWNKYINLIEKGRRYSPFIKKDWKKFQRECLQDKFSKLSFTIVENNNSKILKNIEKGLYTDHNKLEKVRESEQ